jgi:PEP-CTERM motif
MRLILAILAVALLLSVPAAEADSIRDYDFHGFSKPLDFRIGSSHDDLRDLMTSLETLWRREVSNIPMFDESDRHHRKRFSSWRREHKDVPRAVPEPATLLLVSAGIIGMIGGYRLLRV